MELDFKNITPELLEKYYSLSKEKCTKILKNMYYIYYHVDPRTNLPVYVGKGKRERAWDTYDRNYKHNIWTSELKRQGLKPIIDVGNFFESEDEAYLAEEKDIEVLKSLGMELVNLVRGGRAHTADVCNKPIICLNNGKTYPSTRMASDDLNMSPKRINDVLKGRKKTCRGFMFRYVKEELNIRQDRIRLEKKNLEGKNRRKAIICNETGKRYVSIMEAARNLGVCESSIRGYFKGKSKSVKGFTFRRD
jgi:hypothetical protein